MKTSPRQRILLGAFLGVVIIAVRAPLILSAEDRPREIPKDGTCVRYFVETENLTTGEKRGAFTTTLAFVGTTVEEGQTCRWLERTTVIPEGIEGSGTYVVKVLVPEKDLWESKAPFEHVRRAWMLRPNELVVKMAARSLVADINGIFLELMLWTPGMLKDSGPASNESKDIEYQPGRLRAAEARTGKRADERPGPGKDEKSYVAWQHPNLPIGAAEVRIIRETTFNLEKTPQLRISVTYRVQDVGTSAESTLPDNN